LILAAPRDQLRTDRDFVWHLISFVLVARLLHEQAVPSITPPQLHHEQHARSKSLEQHQQIA
jgi:hypothetical protein